MVGRFRDVLYLSIVRLSVTFSLSRESSGEKSVSMKPSRYTRLISAYIRASHKKADQKSRKMGTHLCVLMYIILLERSNDTTHYTTKVSDASPHS
ncbi:hypothetical protein FHG87_010342 [Trinorchestia longiramus]|nr:hypothetical protein FHG87_010342 [Trinorchestia longiramus]